MRVKVLLLRRVLLVLVLLWVVARLLLRVGLLLLRVGRLLLHRLLRLLMGLVIGLVLIVGHAGTYRLIVTTFFVTNATHHAGNRLITVLSLNLSVR